MQTGTITAKPRAYFSANIASQTFRGNAIERQSDGTAVVKDVKVFKAGTFRDSWGDQHTWTAEHLAQMVDNYTLLKAKDIFPDVPARRDHSLSVDKVFGYFESTRTDAQFLYADIHVTDADALDKLINGTFRNFSLEVGMFVANDESAYWPVVYGVACVDIPAVEGLHSKNAQVSFFSMTSEKEARVGTENSTTTTPSGITINLNGQGNLVPDPKPGSTTDHSGGQPITPAAPGTPAPPPFKFRINGAETIDFAAVQAHITKLEGFAQTVFEDNRKNFVAQLAKDKKITAAQVAELEPFAVGLSDEQFTAWSKTYDTAPKLPLLEQHGNSMRDQNQPGNEEQNDERDVFEGQVEMFRRAGKSPEWIAKTEAGIKLAALNATS